MRPTKRQKILEKRQRHKELFDKLYDAAQRGTATGEGELATAFYNKLIDKQEAQKTLNREVLAKMPPTVREAVEGAPPGAYVRIEIEGMIYSRVSIEVSIQVLLRKFVSRLYEQ